MNDYANQGIQPDGYSLHVIQSGTGSFDFACSVLHGFKVGTQLFVFCHNRENKKFTIHELFEGQLVYLADSGELPNACDSADHYEIDGRHFFLMGCTSAKATQIREFNPETLKLSITGNSYGWTSVLPAEGSMAIVTLVKTESYYYAFYQDTHMNVVNMHRLNSDGTLGTFVAHYPQTRRYFDTTAYFTHDGNAYVYAQCTGEKYYEVRRVNNDGTFADNVEVWGTERTGNTFVIYIQRQPHIFSRSGGMFYIQSYSQIVNKQTPVDPLIGTNEISSGPATGFPETDYTYYLVQDSSNKYIIYTVGDASGYKYGPYAYPLCLPALPSPTYSSYFYIVDINSTQPLVRIPSCHVPQFSLTVVLVVQNISPREIASLSWMLT